MKIFLIGLPGSGKTTLGKDLAAGLQLFFVDLDAVIEQHESKTIPMIFSQHGEDYFRQREAELLEQWILSDKDFVMATGGGAPCFFDNMSEMVNAGTTIFLDVPPREIVKRIKRTDRADRPLLGRVHPDELKDQIETLRTRRLKFYSRPRFTFSGEKLTAAQVQSAISG